MSRILVYREHENGTPGLMQCDCGRKIEIYDHRDLHCGKCGRDYNSAGQQLADRSQWGEETGETAMDYDLGAAGYRDPEEVG